MLKVGAGKYLRLRFLTEYFVVFLKGEPVHKPGGVNEIIFIMMMMAVIIILNKVKILKILEALGE